uniref:Uncharacterized protein n=1 Tax=Aegilops tauschii TaxID=37682 RepID=M8CDU5_AEGTA
MAEMGRDFLRQMRRCGVLAEELLRPRAGTGMAAWWNRQGGVLPRWSRDAGTGMATCWNWQEGVLPRWACDAGTNRPICWNRRPICCVRWSTPVPLQPTTMADMTKAGTSRPICWNRLSVLLHTTEHACTTEAGTNDRHVATARRRSTIAGTINFFAGSSDLFCYYPVTMIHDFAGNGKYFCWKHAMATNLAMIWNHRCGRPRRAGAPGGCPSKGSGIRWGAHTSHLVCEGGGSSDGKRSVRGRRWCACEG